MIVVCVDRDYDRDRVCVIVFIVFRLSDRDFKCHDIMMEMILTFLVRLALMAGEAMSQQHQQQQIQVPLFCV